MNDENTKLLLILLTSFLAIIGQVVTVLLIWFNAKMHEEKLKNVKEVLVKTQAEQNGKLDAIHTLVSTDAPKPTAAIPAASVATDQQTGP